MIILYWALLTLSLLITFCIGLSLKFDGSDEVLVTSLPSVFMEREASEVRRGRPTIAPTILKVLLCHWVYCAPYCTTLQDMIIKQVEVHVRNDCAKIIHCVIQHELTIPSSA